MVKQDFDAMHVQAKPEQKMLKADKNDSLLPG